MLSSLDVFYGDFSSDVLKTRAPRMSSPVAKSVKKVASRAGSRRSFATSSTRKRVMAGQSKRLKPATKRSPAGKARARKATKVRAPKQQTRTSISLAKRRGTKKLRKARKPAKVNRRVLAA